jgi:hypothetical protein
MYILDGFYKKDNTKNFKTVLRLIQTGQYKSFFGINHQYTSLDFITAPCFFPPGYEYDVNLPVNLMYTDIKDDSFNKESYRKSYKIRIKNLINDEKELKQIEKIRQLEKVCEELEKTDPEQAVKLRDMLNKYVQEVNVNRERYIKYSDFEQKSDKKSKQIKGKIKRRTKVLMGAVPVYYSQGLSSILVKRLELLSTKPIYDLTDEVALIRSTIVDAAKVYDKVVSNKKANDKQILDAGAVLRQVLTEVLQFIEKVVDIDLQYKQYVGPNFLLSVADYITHRLYKVCGDENIDIAKKLESIIKQELRIDNIKANLQQAEANKEKINIGVVVNNVNTESGPSRILQLAAALGAGNLLEKSSEGNTSNSSQESIPAGGVREVTGE